MDLQTITHLETIMQNLLDKALINFATKDDLKKELNNYVTKDDLKNFATKEDMIIMAEKLIKKYRQVETINKITDSKNRSILHILIDHEKRLKHLEDKVFE